MSTTEIRTKANEIIAIADAMDATPPNTGGTVHASLWFLVKEDGSLLINPNVFPAAPWSFQDQATAESRADSHNQWNQGDTVTATLCNVAS